MVEVTGLEPAASASRTQRSTKLSHTSIINLIFSCKEKGDFQFALLDSLLLRCPKFFTTWGVVKFRPRRLFGFPYSATGSGQPQSYQTEPHLDNKFNIKL